MLNPIDTTAECRESNESTYCAEDDKIRLYIDGAREDGRVERDTYLHLKKLGFKPTPKQDCNFVAHWSPAAEDAALALIGDDDDIGDEDQGPEDRAADRAERFGGYRDKRRAEAHGHADTYDAGPDAFGNQNRARAERQARRHERRKGRALTQWSKAEYWQRRTEGVIRNALHKSSPSVRRGRILVLEKLIRRIEDRNKVDEGAGKHEHDGVTYVWVGKGRAGHWVDESKLAEGLSDREQRRLDHYRLRLNYERAMLEADGGTVTEVEIEPGGFMGGRQIHKVNKSPVTGRVVSVQVAGKDWHGTEALVTVNVERLGEDAYRAPTDEERSAFKAMKSAKPKAPSLINPTPEDAARLQAFWNSQKPDKGPVDVLEMTQKEYTARTKRSDWIRTEHLTKSGVSILYRGDVNKAKAAGNIACKVRLQSHGFCGLDSVIVLTDKPQKPLPLDWAALEATAAEESAVSV